MRIGIYIDAENIMKNGGWGIRYDALWAWAESIVKVGQAEIVRATTYMAVDFEREAADTENRKKNTGYRAQLRAQGFKVFMKPLHRYTDATGRLVQKADCDLDIALDAIQESRNLDMVVLVSGDGDFVRLVNDLQRMGVRVVGVGFMNVSRALREAVDEYHDGQGIAGLLPAPIDRQDDTAAPREQGAIL